MSGLIGALVVFAFLAGIFMVMFRGVGGRVGRPPKGVLTRLRPADEIRWAAAALGGLAIGGFVARFVPDTDTVAGIVLGVVIGAMMAPPVIGRHVVAVVGIAVFVIALVEAYLFIAGDGHYDSLSIAYRVVVMTTILAAYTLGVVVFGRRSAISGPRGYALFALVDVTTFLAAPAGRDALALGVVNNFIYLLIACGAAFVVGWASSEYILSVLAMAVAITTWLQQSVYGNADQAWTGIVTGAAAAATVLLSSRLFGRVRSR
ncbi:hypothetical protein ACIGKQ_21145 [Gordonia sp. NPDC062954]|uniref:hypothetical protein n=1 Tax=Gordonia sp. NPDC062954 TaxID=3364003 RepID=UPI0037C9CBAA